MGKDIRARALEFVGCGLLMALCAACGGGDSDHPQPPPSANNGIGAAGGTVTESSGAQVIIPAGRQGTAWEVAYGALYLLSGESSYVTGQSLVVDGGLTIGPRVQA